MPFILTDKLLVNSVPRKKRGFIAKPKRSGGDRLAHSHAKKLDGEEKEEEGGRWRIALTNCTHSSFSRVFSIAVKREREAFFTSMERPCVWSV